MDPPKKTISEKRKRLQSLFKEHEEKENGNQEFKDFTGADKEKFFKMLKIFNKEAENTEKRKMEVTKSVIEKEEKVESEEQFKIPLPMPSRSTGKTKSQSEVDKEIILALNAELMREILFLKWDRILLEEGCIEDLLDWDQYNHGFETFYENEGRTFDRGEHIEDGLSWPYFSTEEDPFQL